MRAQLLIAANFARDQLWPLFFLLLWVIGWALFGFLSDPRSAGPDALLIFKQLVAYTIAFSVFFGSSAIRADQRSRRIMGVLSKAVSRTQYLAGLLTGIALVIGVFCWCLGFTATWVLGRFEFSVPEIWLGMLALVTACLLTAALTLFFSTFLPPVFSAIGTGLLAGIPAMHERSSFFILPVYSLVSPILAGENQQPWHASLHVLGTAWVEVLILVLAASWIFSRRDLAVATE